MTLRLTTLGTAYVTRGEEAVTSLPGKPMSFGLLVFLGVEREVTRDRLMGTFWPEVDQERARQRLNQAIYELKRELGEDWVESSGNRVRVTEALQIDVLEFEEGIEAGREAEALAVYRGHFLDGVHLAPTHPFQDWMEGKRARLARKHRVAADQRIASSRAAGELEEALQLALKWVGLDPLDDGAQHHAIHLLWETGSRTEALAQYQRYEALLEKELGLEPLDDTKELVEEIRSGTAPPSGFPAAPHEAGAAEALDAHEDSPLSPTTADAPSPTPVRAGGSLANLEALFLAESSGPLEILRPIRQGSTADVFLAREPHLKRLVAVKVLSPALSDDPEASRRFKREAESAARINHPAVCTVLRYGTLENGTPFFVTPFVKGSTVAQRLEGEGRRPPAETREILQEVASALAAAHELGVLHRNVQPDNVLHEDGSNRYFLCDFGLARVLETGVSGDTPLTRPGQLIGDPRYMSPEQAEGAPLTDRSDIFNLGVMGYELLTGTLPPGRDEGGGETDREKAFSILREFAREWPSPDRGLVELLIRCMALDPGHRPSAAELLRKLEGLGKESAPHRDPGPGDRSLFRTLLDRRVPQFLGGYVAAAWMTVESSGYLVGRGILPEVAESLALVTAPFGFFAVSIAAWFHGERGPQEMPPLEKRLLWVVFLAWLVGCFLVI